MANVVMTFLLLTVFPYNDESYRNVTNHTSQVDPQSPQPVYPQGPGETGGRVAQKISMTK